MRLLSLIILTAGVFSACGRGFKPPSKPSWTLPTLETPQDEWDNQDVKRVAHDDDAADQWRFTSLMETCTGDHVRGFPGMPRNHGNASGGAWTYYVEYRQKDPNLPTIINLPGGPGGSSIGNRDHLHTYNFINIDPRGVGCNYHPAEFFPEGSLTSWQTVLDVAAVIRQLGLEEIIIYGHSYGTVTGTMLAHALEQTEEKGALPKAVVLEGVVGQYIGPQRVWMENHFKQWEQLKKENSSINRLFADGFPAVENVSAAEWGSYLFETGNRYRKTRRKLKKLASELAEFEKTGRKGPTIENFENRYRGETGEASFPYPRDFAMILSHVGCRELFADWYDYSVHLEESGRLAYEQKETDRESPNFCEGFSNDRPYDAAEYPVEAPLYYLQGTTDPQTAFEWALYHRHHQEHSSSIRFAAVEEGGHSLTDGPLNGCIEDLWETIVAIQPLDKVLGADGRCQRAQERSPAPPINVNQEKPWKYPL